MNIRFSWFPAVIVATVLAAGCQISKSANPLSPSVAGPIEGVNISQPAALEPGQDWQIFMRDQPIKLLFSNASTNGVRPISYTVEIASDSAFKSVVFKRTGIAPASGSTTTFQLTDPLATGRTYWWHVRAEDGANSSEYSAPRSFVAVTPVTLGPPAATSPSGTIDTITPEFKIQAGNESGPIGRISYMVQVANDQAFASIAAIFIQDETPPVTTVAQNYGFFTNQTYYWRVQARDTGDSQAVSPWSSTQVFTTPAPIAPPPPTGGGGGETLPPVGGNWQACGSTPGDTLVQCVRGVVYHGSTELDAFNITRVVAWLLRNQGFGLLRKDGGENIMSWHGGSFSISRIARPNGGIIKLLSDAGAGGGNGATWDTSLDFPGSVPTNFYIPSMDPSLP